MHTSLIGAADASVAGPLAGGVIGGTILVLLALIIAYLIIKHRGKLPLVMSCTLHSAVWLNHFRPEHSKLLWISNSTLLSSSKKIRRNIYSLK